VVQVGAFFLEEGEELYFLPVERRREAESVEEREGLRVVEDEIMRGSELEF